MLICGRLLKEACKRSGSILPKPTSIGHAQQQQQCFATHIKEPPLTPVCLAAMVTRKSARKKADPSAPAADSDVTTQVRRSPM
jgi:hypothetical protein